MPLLPEAKNCDPSVKKNFRRISKELGHTAHVTHSSITLNHTGIGDQLTLSKICTVAAGLNVLRVTGLQTDATALTGTLRGAYIDVSNGSTEATGTIRALELKARTEAPGDTGSKVAVLEGLSISVDSKAHDVTTMRAAEFILDGKTAGTIDEMVGLRIANNLQFDKATNSYGLQIYRDSFDYTADIQLSSGGLIGGSTGALQVTSGGNIVCQPATDSTTFFQILDADGGTPILNVDSTNERVGIGTAEPLRDLHVAGGSMQLGTIRGVDSNFRIYSDGEAWFEIDNHGNYGGINCNKIYNMQFSNYYDDNGFITFHTVAGGGASQERFRIQNSGRIGIGEAAPETLTEWTHAQPYLTLHNSTHEDSDGGRESRINFKGEQGVTPFEETTLARIEVGHDSAGADDKGKIVFSVNDGDDGNNPTQALEIGSDLLATFAGAVASATLTIHPSGQTNDTNVSGVNTLFLDLDGDANALISGFTGGVDGQVLRVVIIDHTKTVTLQHVTDGGGASVQDLYLCDDSDETLDDFGGWVLICNGSHWYDCGHAKHVA